MPEATQIQLGAERDIGLYELALASAKAGALGGAVGNVPRAMGSYEDWLNTQPKVRGRFSEDEIEDLRAIAKKHDTLSRRMPPGYGLEGEFRYFPYSPIKRTGKADWRTKQGPKARVNIEYKGKRRGEAAIRALQDELESSGYTAKPGGSIQGGTSIISAQPRETQVKPSIKAKAEFLRGAAKDAFSLKNILTDATIGSLVGLASTVGPYEAYRPRTGGTFTAPGPGYEDALSKKDILEIAAMKEAENDARRLAGIEEVNEVYGPGTLGPNARMAEIADYLGPIR